MRPGKITVRTLREAQTAVEYLLLLGAVVVVVLLAFRTLIPQDQAAADGYFNAVARGVYGTPVVVNMGATSFDRTVTIGANP